MRGEVHAIGDDWPYHCIVKGCGLPMHAMLHVGIHLKCQCKVIYAKTLRGIEPLWSTRDGRMEIISELETKHLNFIIAMMISRGGEWRQHYMQILLDELERRLRQEENDAAT